MTRGFSWLFDEEGGGRSGTANREGALTCKLSFNVYSSQEGVRTRLEALVIQCKVSQWRLLRITNNMRTQLRNYARPVMTFPES